MVMLEMIGIVSRCATKTMKTGVTQTCCDMVWSMEAKVGKYEIEIQAKI